MESVGGRHSEANALRPGQSPKAPHPACISGPVAAPWGIWGQDQDSLPSSPFPAVFSDFSLSATNLHQSPGTMLNLARIGKEAGMGGCELASVSP